MKQEHEVRDELRRTKEKQEKQPDPMINAVYRDRASTLEWVLGA